MVAILNYLVAPILEEFSTRLRVIVMNSGIFRFEIIITAVFTTHVVLKNVILSSSP